MAEIGNHLLTKSFEANGAIPAHAAVIADTTNGNEGKVVVATANVGSIVGFYDTAKAAAAGDRIGVVVDGTVFCIAAGGREINVGDPITTAANGRVDGASTGNNVIGYAVSHAEGTAGVGVHVRIDAGNTAV